MAAVVVVVVFVDVFVNVVVVVDVAVLPLLLMVVVFAVHQFTGQRKSALSAKHVKVYFFGKGKTVCMLF